MVVDEVHDISAKIYLPPQDSVSAIYNDRAHVDSELLNGAINCGSSALEVERFYADDY